MHMLEQSNISPMVVKILSRDIVNGCFFYFYIWLLKGGLEERTGVDTMWISTADCRYKISSDINSKGHINKRIYRQLVSSRGSLQKSGSETDHCTAVINIIAR